MIRAGGGNRPGTPPPGPLVMASPGTGPGWIGAGWERDGDIPVALFSTAADNVETGSPSTSASQRDQPPHRSSTAPIASQANAAAAFSTISLPNTTATSSTSTAQPQFVPVAPGLPSHAPGSTVPILLPGYATRKIARDRFPQTWAAVDKPEDLDDGEVEIEVYLHGMVLKTMESLGTRQRVFNQMAKQVSWTALRLAFWKSCLISLLLVAARWAAQSCAEKIYDHGPALYFSGQQ
jgi:hypothetical protein